MGHERSRAAYLRQKREEAIFLGREIAQHRDYSEDTAIKIDGEVRSIVTNGYSKARNILETQRDKLERIAQALLDREVLDAVELKLLMEGKPLPEKIPPPPPAAPPVPTKEPQLSRGPNRGRFLGWPRAKNRLRLRFNQVPM